MPDQIILLTDKGRYVRARINGAEFDLTSAIVRPADGVAGFAVTLNLPANVSVASQPVPVVPTTPATIASAASAATAAKPAA